jgi:hypothetical protein
MYEEDLHEIFYRFPYLLIDKPVSIINTIHEYKLDSDSIPDIYIETLYEKYYCEIKLGALKEIDLYQAIRYLNTIKAQIEISKNKDHKNFLVLLIGMNISGHLEYDAKKKSILVKIVGRNLPESIKICKICRKAYDSKEIRCNFCNSEDFLEVITLKYP